MRGCPDCSVASNPPGTCRCERYNMPRTPSGQILRVDLTSGTIRVEPLLQLEARAYMGGGGLAAALVLRTGAPESDPLGPDNVLIFAPGLLAGLDAPGLAKHAVLAKSPLTGTVGETQCEGWWGPELKRAGFDALVVEGVSERPVWLHVKDGVAELRTADDLWGLDVGATTDRVLAACDDRDTRVAAIGPAGERGVRYASIVNDYMFVSHRMGFGAVMGAKRLKAIAVRGTQPVEAADPGRVRDIADALASHFLENPVNRLEHDFGLAGEVPDMQDYGMLPAHN